MSGHTKILPAFAALSAALAVIAPQAALAQEADATPPAADETINVTASRISRAGFTAPTPTAVIGFDTIGERGHTTISDVLLDLPELRASRQPTTTSNNVRGPTSSPDVRGMGEERTLLLIDGMRATPTQLHGVSDLSLIPVMMIDRVEIVTGGVSASWGSDAVAGVVNLILKKQANGLQGDVSYGISQEGDNEEWRVGLVGGSDFADGRGHFVFGLDYIDNGGIGDNYNRDWGRKEFLQFNNPCAGALGAPSTGAGCGGVANGLPQRVLAEHVVNLGGGSGTRGGLITAVAGGTPTSLLFQRFNDAGTSTSAHPLGPPQLTSSTQTVIAASAEDTYYNGTDFPLLPTIERYSGMGRVSYDLTDSLTFDASFLAAGFKGVSTLGVTGYGGMPGTGNVTIRKDNAFLPAAIAAQMPTNGTFTLARRFTELGSSLNIVDSMLYQFNAGITGHFGDTWQWDLRAVTGENKFEQEFIKQPIVGRAALATDAVRVTAGNVGTSGLAIGSIACRSTLTAPTNGCVPMNPFGNGNISQAAFDYVIGVGSNERTMEQTQIAANIQGDIFATWAGPVSLAAGVEYRDQSAEVVSDARSQANGFVVSGVNQKAMSADYSVQEIYGEVVVPLAANAPLAEELDLTLAGRHTDYSTSGEVDTWKVGVSYRPFDDLRLRLTRSRDIRAPNLLELFSPTNPSGSPGFLIDPRTGLAPQSTTGQTSAFFNTGNPALLPELADTLTYGFVYQPGFIPGLSVSVDYAHIEVEDAIGLVTTQNVLNQCFTFNNPTACALITTGPGNTIQQINTSYINLASLDFKSIDWEVQYRFPLSNMLGDAPGEMVLGILGSHNIDMIFNDGITTPIDRAGEVGGGASSARGRPSTQITGTVGYNLDRFHAGMVLKYLSEGVLSKADCDTSVTCTPPIAGGFTVNDNSVPSYLYINLNASVDIISNEDRELELFGVINNVTDRDPPATGGSQSNPNIYDIIGRTFRVGVRFKY